MAASLIAEKGELPSGLTFFGSRVFIRCSDMGIALSKGIISSMESKELNEPAKQESAKEVGSKLLSKYSDTESLFVRNMPSAVTASTPKVIPLQRSQELEQAIRSAPANPEPYVELGQIYIDQQRWTDARRVLDAAVEYCPEHEPALILHEDLMIHLSSMALEQARKLNAQRPSEESRYGLEQAETDLANRRVKVCSDRYKRHPEQKEILIPWAVAMRQLGREDQAVEYLQEAAEDPSLRARASLQLGMCLESLERPLEALAAFRKAALYRSPPPDPLVRTRALELAIAIAEENGLIDSARYYTEQLLQFCDSSQKEALALSLRRLEATEL
jgi:tetratricopeptide (TPR) repeat protein